MMKHILKSVKTIFNGAPNAGHDITHTLRVRELCIQMGRIEGGDVEVLEASSLLHDIGRAHEFADPTTDHALIASQEAPRILSEAGFPQEKIQSVVYAIKNHRYSSGIYPCTLEAQILQDADRLDIAGAVGVAMTFAYSGALNRPLYHPDDPLATMRDLDDSRYALDHIFSKLLLLPGSMHTKTARTMAKERNEFIKDFIEQFYREITFHGRTEYE